MSKIGARPTALPVVHRASPSAGVRAEAQRIDSFESGLPRLKADRPSASRTETVLRAAAVGLPSLVGMIAPSQASAAAVVPSHAVPTDLAQSLLFKTPETQDTLLERLETAGKQDGWISSEEFAPIRADIEKLPDKPTKESEALLKWFLEALGGSDHRIALSTGVRDFLDAKLRACGYELWPNGEGITPTSMIPELVERAAHRPAPSPTQLRAMFKGTLDQTRFEGSVLPQLWRIPRTASVAGRELVRVYGDPSVKMSPEIAQKVGGILRGAGYPVELDRRPSPTEAQRAIDEAIHETDPGFARVLSAVGRQDAKTQIGVIDGGFEVTHPALAGKLAKNLGEVSGNNIDDDGNGFVDDVFGIRAADKSTGNLWTEHGMGRHGTNVAGIATKGTDRIEASLVAVGGKNVGEQVDYLVQRGARVINMSLEFREASDAAALRQAILDHPNVVFVLSAGNDGTDLMARAAALRTPYAAADNLLVVTATDAAGHLIPGANFGAELVTHAARSTILSADGNGRYMAGAMTSMATPHVTNILAKCLTIDPQLSPKSLSDLLTRTSTRSAAWDGKVKAGGTVDGQKAVEVAGLTALLRTGVSGQEAGQKLGLSSDRLSELLPIAQTLLGL